MTNLRKNPLFLSVLHLKSVESRTYEELDRALTEAINLVTDNDIIGWFTHCCYYVPPN